MSKLITMIRDQKFIEAEASLHKIINEKDISPEAWVYQVNLSKERFKNSSEAIEYIKSKWFDTDKFTESESEYIFEVANKRQLDLMSDSTFEVSRGVIVQAADFRPETIVNFNSKAAFGELRIDTLNLNDTPNFIEICKVIEGYHPNYGEIKITKEDLKSFAKNFKDKVTQVDLAVNEDHKKEKAFGWFIDVFLSHDETTLYGQVVWNSAGIKSLQDKEYRYFSPELRFNFIHPHSKKEYGPTLLGGALTNYPFLKMAPIVDLTNKGDDSMELKDAEKKILELSNKVLEQDKDLHTSKTIIEKIKAENVELSAKISKIEKEQAEKEKLAKNEKLFSEGKINKAQLDALNAGKDLFEVLSLNSGLNTKPVGSEHNNENDVNLNEDEKAMCKKLGLTEEEFKKYNS